MSKIKISEMNLTEQINDDDLLMVIQNNENKKTKKSNLLQEINKKITKIRNQMPTITVEGENLTLDGTAEDDFRKFVVKGNTKQDSYTGKNLLHIIDGIGTLRGITSTRNNGIIAVSGTATGNTPFPINGNATTYSSGNYVVYVPNPEILILPAGTYTFSSQVTNGTSSNNFAIVGGKKNNATPHTTLFEKTFTNNKIEQTFTIEQESEVFFGFQVANGATVDLAFNIMLEQGSTATSYEPYVGGIASPSPEYPQEIKVVTGNSTVKVGNKNLFDINNPMYVNVPLQEGGNINGTSAVSNVSQYIKVLENNTYTLSLSNDSNIRRICFYSNPIATEEPNVNGFISTINYNGNTKIFTTPLGCNYIRFGYYNDTQDIQLEQGTTATDYVPHQEQTYPLTLGSIELCKIGTYQDYIHKDNGKWYKHKEIGKGTISLAGGTYEYGSFRNYWFPKPSDAIDYTIREGGVVVSRIATSTNLNADVKISTSANRYSYGIEYPLTYTPLPTVEELRTLVNGTPYYYVLATPVEEEITDTTLIEQLEAINNATSYKGQTNIFSTNEISPIFEVETYEDLPSKLENIESRLALLE